MLQAPPNWNMETINKCSFVNFYNVKPSIGKQKTHSNHNVGRFSPRYHVATIPVRVEITGVGIPGVWVIFAENLKVINVGKCSHRWQFAREPRFVLFWWWTGSTALSTLTVHVLNKMLWPFTTSARTTRSKLFLAKPEFRKVQIGKEKHKVHRVLNKMLWPFTTSAHTTRCRPFLAPISFRWRRRRHTFSCPFLNEDQEQEPFAPNWSASSVLALVWSTPVLASLKGCWRDLLVNLHAPTPFAQIGQDYLRGIFV